MTWKHGTFHIAGGGEATSQVSGVTSGVFGVHRSALDGGYVVTHLPTGMAICHTFEPGRKRAFRCAYFAQEFADAILPLTDWSAVNAQNAEDTGKRLRQTIQDVAAPIVACDAAEALT